MSDSNAGDKNDLGIRLAAAAKALEERFGVPVWKPKDPLDELMVTILSQNTNDANRDAAYKRLRERFPSWDLVERAPVGEIEAAIRPAGLSIQKSANLLNALHWIKATFGDLTLEALRAMPDDEVLELLTTQKGIGIKTAAVVLAFSLGRDICPVDTHVHRISIRQGWAQEGTSAIKTFHILRDHIPKGKAGTFHLNLLKFGRNICLARSPRCGECPLYGTCVYPGKKRV